MDATTCNEKRVQGVQGWRAGGLVDLLVQELGWFPSTENRRELCCTVGKRKKKKKAQKRERRSSATDADDERRRLRHHWQEVPTDMALGLLEAHSPKSRIHAAHYSVQNPSCMHPTTPPQCPPTLLATVTRVEAHHRLPLPLGRIFI